MKAALYLAILLFSSVAQAAVSQSCYTIPNPIPNTQGEACVYPGDASNKDVLYYLHGLGGSAREWGDGNDWAGQIRDYWQVQGISAPTIVAISFGPQWLLAPKTSAPGGFGFLDFFTARVMPEIESKLGGIKGRRLLFGISMGGFNALQLGLKTDLFQKVTALCAPMADGVGPFSADSAVDHYIYQSTAFRSGRHSFKDLREVFNEVRKIVKFFWVKPEEWSQSEPISLARSLRTPRGAAFYLAAGYYDQYLTYEGNIAFARELAKSGTKVEWRAQWGDHCAIDIPSVAEFMAK